ncbi:MAG: hypothetical protein EBX41_10625, partial [Chitinophagia bacterium]|nr:hypothetical protein [Chitinophagia bacterium]
MGISWWKVAGILLVGYTLIGGLLMPVPRMDILNETIRNLYFHVPMWFTMIALFTVGAVYSIMYLTSGNMEHDIKAVSFTNVGIMFSILGMLTGMEWAQYTWGAPWSDDVKQRDTAICMLMYFAYTVLRGGMKDEEKRARQEAAALALADEAREREEQELIQKNMLTKAERRRLVGNAPLMNDMRHDAMMSDERMAH